MIPEYLLNRFEEANLDPLKCKIGNRFISYNYEDDSRLLVLGGIDLQANLTEGITCLVKFLKFEKLSDIDIEETPNYELRTSIRPYLQRNIIDYKIGSSLDSMFPLDNRESKDLEILIDTIGAFYKKYARYFFSYWNDIRRFLPFIEEDNEAAIELLGNNYIIRKMVIWKLCDHPRYEEFVDQRVSIIEGALKADPENKEYEEVLGTIRIKYDHLEKIAPDFEWNPQYLVPKPYNPDDYQVL